MYYLKKSLISILAFFIALETSGIVFYAVKQGGFFYSRNLATSAPIVDESSNQAITKFSIHPILSFILKPGINLASYLPEERLRKLYELSGKPEWLQVSTNNYGFFSKFNYPLTIDRSKKYVIGIFGGSVAHWFATQASGKFITLLNDNNFSNGKEIIILNFAAGGYKQPQQLIALNYFMALGQHFDLVINIDGFNEIALSALNIQNDIAFEMPSYQHMSALKGVVDSRSLTNKKLVSMSRIVDAKEKLSVYSSNIQSATFATSYLLYDLLTRYYKSQYEQEKSFFDKIPNNQDSVSNFHINSSESKKLNYAQMIDLWFNSSLQMYYVLKEKQIPYLHVLQPNQYYSRKKFSKNESLIALVGDSVYKNYATEGYPFLAEKGKEFNQLGVNFFDATNVFDMVEDIIYSDNCCHYNQKGNEVLAEAIYKKLH
jgi:hypothetical protein